jgi:hypothetical protein
MVLSVDGLVPLSNIGGTDDVDDISTEHDISTVHETVHFCIRCLRFW